MLLTLHAGFMVTGLALVIAGVCIARFMRKKAWWLRGHRALGTCGAISVLCGIAAAAAMVAGFGGPHFQVLHAWVGGIVALFAVATPILGHLQFTLKSRRAEIRKAHRWSGAMTLILLSLNILSGLVVAEILPNMRSF
jgi:hypothetical protein